MSYLVTPVERPLDMIGATNGMLDPDLLVPIGPSGQLHHTAARAWRALRAAALADGFVLVYTFGGTYRPYTGQELLFRSRYMVGGTEGGCKLWNAARWCKKLVNGRVPASAAVPGTSNHGWGLAVDTALDHDPTDGANPEDAESIMPAIAWLQENAPRFGFSWEL